MNIIPLTIKEKHSTYNHICGRCNHEVRLITFSFRDDTVILCDNCSYSATYVYVFGTSRWHLNVFCYKDYYSVAAFPRKSGAFKVHTKETYTDMTKDNGFPFDAAAISPKLLDKLDKLSLL